MSTGWIVLIVVLVILIGVLVGLYFFGKKAEKIGRAEAGSTAGTDGCHGADCQHADHR